MLIGGIILSQIPRVNDPQQQANIRRVGDVGVTFHKPLERFGGLVEPAYAVQVSRDLELMPLRETLPGVESE